jgi:hypothetical protein
MPIVRRSGRVAVRASDLTLAPFAAATPTRSHVVVPSQYLESAGALRLILAHEGHHLRAGHLRSAAALALLDALMPFGGLRAWRAALGDLEERACDAHVVSLRRVDARDYSTCLESLATARPRHAAFLTAPLPLLLTPMAAAPASSLRRRLEMLHDPPRPARTRSALLALALTSTVAASAVGIGLAVGPAPLDESHAARVAAVTPAGGIEVPANDMVLAALARRTGTEEGRAATRAALARMPDLSPVMREVLAAHALPDDLLAVVLVESGFQVGVRPPPSSRFDSAGPWQFISSTARRYGLAVDDVRDERLEPRLSTEAAATMLADLRARYGEWPLALLAYNQGEKAVDRAIARGGTRDVFELERSGEIPDYVSSVYGAMLVLRDPSLAQ